MKDALRVLWDALRDTADEFFMLVLTNAVTLLLLIPLVTAPPALAGLWAVGNRIAQGQTATWRDYFGGFRQHFARAWALAALHLVALFALASNLWFYTPGNNPFDLSPQVCLLIRAAWIGVGIFWLLLSQYFLPLLIEQEDRRLRVTLRNAAALLVMQPGFAVTLLVLITLTGALSTLFTVPWFVITLSFWAVLTNRAVRRLLEPMRGRGDGETGRGGDGETR